MSLTVYIPKVLDNCDETTITLLFNLFFGWNPCCACGESELVRKITMHQDCKTKVFNAEVVLDQKIALSLSDGGAVKKFLDNLNSGEAAPIYYNEGAPPFETWFLTCYLSDPALNF